ncbi:hypothetical protein JX266_007674 [Neoarthrinium moseri]|nr:hypothetical protein JX266_007674 [Neoarthrinium moseri]
MGRPKRPPKSPLSGTAAKDGRPRAPIMPKEQQPPPPLYQAAMDLIHLGIEQQAQHSVHPSPLDTNDNLGGSEHMGEAPRRLTSNMAANGPDLEVSSSSSPGASSDIATGTSLPPLSDNSLGLGLVSSGEGVYPPSCYIGNRDVGDCLFRQDTSMPWSSGNAYDGNLDSQLDVWPCNNSASGGTAAQKHSYNDTASLATANRQELDITLDVCNPSRNCYVALLSRLTQLESYLASRPLENPAPIDDTLRATKDLLDLKERIYSCRGHAIPGGRKSPSCLLSSRPIILFLCLLTERIVYLFEDLFRRAPSLIQPFTEALQPPAYGPNWQRSMRAVRSLLDYSSTCPFPDANRPLQIGSMEVSNEVKTRALRRILRGRIERLLVMLEDMKRMSGPRGEEDGGRQSHSPDRILGPDGGCGAANHAASRQTVAELYLRVEMLLGRLTLTA